MSWEAIKYVIPERPDILFIGINPHPGSYRRGVPFSNNKNFWYNLSRAGLIGVGIEELRDDERLKNFYLREFSKSYGFMNLVNRPTKDTTKLRKNEEKGGIIRIKRVIQEKKPLIVCFIGKITYSKFSGSRRVALGLGNAKLFDSLVYVSSFPIRGPNDIRIRELQEIKDIIVSMRKN
ncbi:MAG: uracil-DNA glycosylase family protein [Thermoplasmata archaeon]